MTSIKDRAKQAIDFEWGADYDSVEIDIRDDRLELLDELIGVARGNGGSVRIETLQAYRDSTVQQKPSMVMMTRAQAAMFIGEHSDMGPSAVDASTELRAEACRRATERLHPDANGGDDSKFKLLQEAIRALDAD